MRAGDKWLDRNAGPVVRPYALTGGRTESADGEVLDLVAVVVASRRTAAVGDSSRLSPEHRRILTLCREPATVADIAAGTQLPLGVVRVLLGDLILQNWITVAPQQRAGEQASPELLKEILHGLRAL